MPATSNARGRPKTTGPGTGIQVRFHEHALASLDRWIAAQPGPRPSRPEAIRRLVTQALASASKPRIGRAHKAATKASELAGAEIDRLADASATDAERQIRKRRILKGPVEFRDIRSDQPKRKG